jgi:hypothetical protein
MGAQRVTALVLFLALVVAHALCDYPLQGDFLARAKNHRAPIAGVDWWIPMAAHCAIHAGAVGLIVYAFTPVPVIAIAAAAFEAGWHYVLDVSKNDGLISFRDDQLFHVFVKVLIALPWLA